MTIEPLVRQPKAQSVSRPRGEIWVAGFPSSYGGADTELDHMIDLWLDQGVAVHLVPTSTPPLDHLENALRRGCAVHDFHPSVFADRVVVSFCNGEFLARLPEIVAAGRPSCVVWANCMTWNFDAELAAHAAGLIDVFVFQSAYQRDMVAPPLEAIAPLRTLDGYVPYFNPANAMQDLAFTYTDPAERGYFGLGRVSRDDGYKYPADMWRIFAQVVAPLPTKTFILGFGENAQAKCGAVPPCDWLDWMTWSPGATTPRDLYGRIHVLIHKTGGSRENWPRTILEAMASGVAVVAERAWALPQMVEDGVTGFLCSSSAEMSLRASQLAFDEPLRRDMVHNARDRILSVHGNGERAIAPWLRLLAEFG